MTDNKNALNHLRKVATNSNLSLLFCPRCPNVYASIITRRNDYTFASDLSCAKCSSTWSVCNECPKQRNRYTTKKQVGDHQRKNHPKSVNRKRKGNPNSLKASNTSEDDAVDNFECIADPEEIDIFHGEEQYDRIESMLFFQNNHTQNQGIEYLVGKCNFHMTGISHNLRPAEVDLYLTLSRLIGQLPTTAYPLLANLLLQVILCDRQQRTDMLTGDGVGRYRCQLPTTPQLIRSRFDKGEHAIFQNLPYPKIHTVGPHAYVLPSQCINDLLGYGFDIVTLQESPLSSTGTGKEMVAAYSSRLNNLKESGVGNAYPPLCLWQAFWSDDFEPNYSTKANRGSVWIMTMTIAMPHQKGGRSVYTYPIAVSPKGADHNEVHCAIREDIKALRQGPFMKTYSGATRLFTEIHSDTYAVLQDHPERRNDNGLALGSSSYGARWGYAFQWNSVSSVLPACSDCLTQMLSHKHNESWVPMSCEACTNWAVNIRHPLLVSEVPDELSVIGTSDYTQDGFLRPVRLEYETLLEAAEATHAHVLRGDWTNKEARVFLSMFALSDATKNQILECVSNCAFLQRIADDEITDSGILKAVYEEIQHHPEKYKQWLPPSNWIDGRSLWRRLETAMHLLFLNATKNTVKHTHQWCRCKEKETGFRRSVAGLLDLVQKLNLDWCKVISLTGENWGGWISENWLGLCRILPWFYSQLDSVVPDKPYEEPDTPFQQWTAAQIKAWLGARGVDKKGIKAELYERMTALRGQQGGPPDLINKRGGPVEDVMMVIFRLNQMIAWLMRPDTSGVEYHSIALLRVRLFLNSFATMDAALKDKKKKSPSWISQYSYMSLLNLPEQIASHGPLRLMWEGGAIGEGYIREVKQLTMNRKGRWNVNLLENLYHRKSMNNLQKIRDATRNEKAGKERKDTGLYFTYPVIGEVIQAMHSRKPVSAVVFSGGDKTKECFGVCFRVFKTYRVMPIQIIPGTSKMDNHWWYARWDCLLNLSNTDILSTGHELDNIEIHAGALLLPMLNRTETHSRYTMIDSRWKSLNENGQLSYM